MMLWLFLLAQTGAAPAQVYNDEDGFSYNAAEAQACMNELRQTRNSKMAIWRKHFHDCVEQYRSNTDLESKRRAQHAAEKEAIRQDRAQIGGQQIPPKQQLDGIEYIEVEAPACQMELDALRDAIQPIGNRRADPNVVRMVHRQAHAHFEECLDRLRAEAKREDQEEAHNRRRAREEEARELAEKLIEQPEARKIDLSALLCTKLEARREIMGELAKDRKYAAIGGAVNLTRRVKIQDELAGLDDEIRTVRAVLKRYKTTPLSCGDAKVKAVAECMSEDAPEECTADPRVRAHVLAAKMLME
jgi:hypothetical protein